MYANTKTFGFHYHSALYEAIEVLSELNAACEEMSKKGINGYKWDATKNKAKETVKRISDEYF